MEKMYSYENNTTILAIDDYRTVASEKLQSALYAISAWLHKWKIKIDTEKSTRVTFTTRKGEYHPEYRIELVGRVKSILLVSTKP